MKNYIIVSFLFFPYILSAQDDTYQLFKNGESYDKPVYYLNSEEFEIVKELDQNRIVFLSDKNKFIHIKEKNKIYELKKNQLSKIKIIQSVSLYKYEEQEFNKTARQIQKETGFKPLFPITHHILKIFILREIDNCYYIYEVEWLKS